MKTRIRPSLRSALVLATAFILPALASAQVLHTWNFNDTAGTALNASPSTSSISFDTALAGVTTNGTGGLSVAYTGASTLRSYANIPDVSTGTLQVDILITSWDLSGVTAAPLAGPLVEFGFYNVTGASNANRTALIQFAADNTQTELVGLARGTGSADTAVIGLGKVQTTPINFRLITNFDNDTYSVGHSRDNYVSLVSGTMAADRGANFFVIRTLDNLTVGGGSFTVDSVTVSAIPEPATAAALLGVAALTLVAARRRRR